MARTRTPTSLLKMRNGGKLRPCRNRDNEPVPPGELGPPPDRMNPEEMECWHEIAHQAPRGVLGSSDRWTVELTAKFMCRFRNGTATATEMRALLSMLGRMGMTPSDRARLSIPLEKPANRFADLVQKPN